jgi:vacuolar-type H+-ATPase subunit H
VIEQDVIGHLIDVERLAYDLLLDAQTEADKRKNTAKEEAETRFRNAYEELLAHLDAELTRERSVCNESRESDLADFNAHLSSITLDRKAFNDYLDSLYTGS